MALAEKTKQKRRFLPSTPQRPASRLPFLFKPLFRLADSLTHANLWLSILALASNSPVYAYQLPADIHSRFGFKPSRLMVYLVLYKLEGEGLLHSFEKGQRRYYTLTAGGKKCLTEGKQMMLERAREL